MGNVKYSINGKNKVLHEMHVGLPIYISFAESLQIEATNLDYRNREQNDEIFLSEFRCRIHILILFFYMFNLLVNNILISIKFFHC